ncbi:MAG: methionine gamma-lyase family protein, partial [Bacillota bacterium]|nr:methionine gamma-lyase family protein [Bacillota bacterium]
MSFWGISPKAFDIVHKAEERISVLFPGMERTAEENQYKVLRAFQQNSIAARHFAPSSGYGYGDEGRDALDSVFASAFGCEDALARPQIVSGTHAIALCFFALLRPGDTLLSATGAPYDTLQSVIGSGGRGEGSLAEYGIQFKQIDLINDEIDIPSVTSTIKNDRSIKAVFIQRSRGYAWREALLIGGMEKAIKQIKSSRDDLTVIVDNCYGEFVDTLEPVNAGADIMAGSLIKNPGGGLAPTGGYIAGRKELVQKAACRLTSPGIGREVGSYIGGYASFYQGLFMAPHTVCQALKTAALFAAAFESLGYECLPKTSSVRGDIIQAIKFNDEEKLIAFCRAIQRASAVDSAAIPEPWDMPGYQDKVIMAAGTFIQGASIELSADAPIRKPYIAYMQGALTYAHGKLAAMVAV